MLFHYFHRLAMVVVLVVSTFIIPARATVYTESLENSGILNDGKVHVILLGTGCPDVEMQEVRKPSCLAVIANRQFLLFDAGEAAIQTIASLGLPYREIDKIFMTHWHSDHFAGLGQVNNASWLHGRKKQITVYGPFGTRQIVENLNHAYELDNVFRAVSLGKLLDLSLAPMLTQEFDAKHQLQTVYNENGLLVSVFLVDHNPVVPAVGYVLQYKGLKIVISGDTRVVDSLEEQSRNADILISEAFSHKLAQFEMDRDRTAGADAQLAFIQDIKKYHADTIELAQMAQHAGVKRLVLTHLVPPIPTTREAKDEFTQGMSDNFNQELTVADDGDEIIAESTSGPWNIQYVPRPQLQIKTIRLNKSDLR